MVFIFGIAALILSITAFLASTFPITLIVISGILGIFSNGRGLNLGLIAVSINFLHFIFMTDTTYTSDWITNNAGIGWNGVFATLMLFQLMCFSVLLWKWAFPITNPTNA